MEKLHLASTTALTDSDPSFPTIVLIDDDLEDCALFAAGFAALHVRGRLLVLHDGEQLMQYLHQSPLPALLFLDLNMPRKNGQQCLLEIKADPRLEGLPVVILSTSTNPAQTALALASGARAYYSKPASFALLLGLVEEAVLLVLDPAMFASPTETHLP